MTNGLSHACVYSPSLKHICAAAGYVQRPGKIHNVVPCPVRGGMRNTMWQAWVPLTFLTISAVIDVSVNTAHFLRPSELKPGRKFDVGRDTADIVVLSWIRAIVCFTTLLTVLFMPKKLPLSQWISSGTLLVILVYLAIKAANFDDVADQGGLFETSFVFAFVELLSVLCLVKLYRFPSGTKGSWGMSASSLGRVSGGQHDEEFIDAEPDTGGFGNPYLRYTILYAGLILVISTMPIWMAAIIPGTIHVLNIAFLAFFSIMWIWIACNAVHNFRKIGYRPVTKLGALRTIRKRVFRHAVIIPIYTEELSLLYECIGSLVLQGEEMRQRMVVVVSFESKTPQVAEKMRKVTKRYGKLFGKLLVVKHTLIASREIPGACSNKNYGLRAAHAYLQRKFGKNREKSFMIHNFDDTGDRGSSTALQEFNPGQGWKEEAHGEEKKGNAAASISSMAFTCTTTDTDSMFHPEYFLTLEAVYNAKNPRLDADPKMVAWQPPLFYNWDLDKRPFFVRVTGIIRAMMMLGGLISFDLNPMSTFSYPLELGARTGYLNPRYGVDDIIAKVRWMCGTGESVPVELLPIPNISGPTSGSNLSEELHEWSRQVRRWIVGASESFHYFLIHFKGDPLFAGLRWLFLFFTYYGVLLCSAAVFQILASVPLPWVDYPAVHYHSGGKTRDFNLRYLGLMALTVQYIVFAVAFVIDHYAVRMMRIRESIHPLRNLAHWLLAPWVLMAYSIVAFTSILKFVCVGKKLARHDMAEKTGLLAEKLLPTNEGKLSDIQDGDNDRKMSEKMDNHPAITEGSKGVDAGGDDSYKYRTLDDKAAGRVHDEELGEYAANDGDSGSMRVRFGGYYERVAFSWM
eukprot:jgi/Bigna1/67270/fgenesh1_pg.3_\